MAWANLLMRGPLTFISCCGALSAMSLAVCMRTHGCLAREGLAGACHRGWAHAAGEWGEGSLVKGPLQEGPSPAGLGMQQHSIRPMCIRQDLHGTQSAERCRAVHCHHRKQHAPEWPTCQQGCDVIGDHLDLIGGRSWQCSHRGLEGKAEV